MLNNENDNFIVEVGLKLKQLRNEKGLSTREVETITGISRSTISAYENGLFNQKIKIIRKLAEFYNEDINWIIGEVAIRKFERK